MRHRIRLSPRAADQIDKAERWWAENRTKAPNALSEDIDAAFRLLAELPDAGELVRRTRIPNLRRFLLPRVRYFLYYSLDVDNAVVEILALWHTSRGRRPNLR